MEAEAEKLLSESLNKCRCCFRMLIDVRRSVKISEGIKLQFTSLTNIELLESDIFANHICQLCASDLTMFSTLRDDLISKQKSLYSLAGLEESQFQLNLTNQANDEERTETYKEDDFGFETLEEDVGEMYVEQMDYEDTASIEGEESVSATESIVKIEKIDDSSEVQDKSTADESEYALFEEIATDEGEKYFEKSENLDNNDSSNEKFNVIISCDSCGIEVPKHHFSQHIVEMHNNFDCEECSRSFSSKIALKRHSLEIHPKAEKLSRSKNRHYCPLCDRNYDYKKQLEDHIRSFHDRERNSQCHICHKTFYHRDLKKHIDHVHGNKTISCGTCGKMYTCIENLRLHMRYHQPPGYHCTYKGCEKKFHQKVLLDHHMKKHTDIKPFLCGQCTTTFYSERDLKRHVQRVHQKITRKCLLCEMQFSRKDKLRMHLLKKHMELDEDQKESILTQIRTMNWNES